MKKRILAVVLATVAGLLLSCSEGDEKQQSRIEKQARAKGRETAEQIQSSINQAKAVQQLSQDRMQEIDETAKEK